MIPAIVGDYCWKYHMSARATVLVFGAVTVLAVVGWLSFRSAATPATVPGSSSGAPAAAPAAAAAPMPPRSSAPGSSVAATPGVPARSPSLTSSATIPDVPPAVRPNANANVASVAEAARTNTHPERLSPLIAPRPFDAAAFAADPQGYLNVVEPGRVFQSAAPGAAVPVLQVKGKGSIEIAPGGACPLAVITAPNAPVTFTSLDLGTFPNQLTSITVRADAQGEARTEFAASGGAIADVQVMVGSPGASGQVKFQIFIAPPRPATAARSP